MRWRTFSGVLLYRLLLSVTLFLALPFAGAHSWLNVQFPSKAFIISAVYCAISVLLFLVSLRKDHYKTQVLCSGVSDIVLLTTLVYCTGGISAPLSMLVNISVALHCYLAFGRYSIFLAAVASLGLLVCQTYAVLHGLSSSYLFMHVSIHGLSYFVIALLMNALNSHLTKTEALAQSHASHAMQLLTLNSRIIDYLESGIICFNLQGDIELWNKAASRLLPGDKIPLPISQGFKLWKNTYTSQRGLWHEELNDYALQANFIPVGDDDGAKLLIVLEDISRAHYQAQELKLASLGRFTASIAHELRNPLGAIGHAAQLLQESPMVAEDQRLTTIIMQHVTRMNTIIKNILQLSRRQPSHPDAVFLRDLLEECKNIFNSEHSMPVNLSIAVEPEDLKIIVDPSQFQQVFSILVDNSIKHANMELNDLHITVQAKIDCIRQQGVISISDNGKGITENERDCIFEPFFTGNHHNVGLGLYIARELCHANQGQLHCMAGYESGALFQLALPIRENV